MAFLAPLAPTSFPRLRRSSTGGPAGFLAMRSSSPPGARTNRPPRPPPRRGSVGDRVTADGVDTTAAAGQATWQEQLQLFLSPSMNGSARATLGASLLRRSPEVLRDVRASACAAVGSASRAPSSSSSPPRPGGQATGGGLPVPPPSGVEGVVRQLREDVLPDVLRNGTANARRAAASLASSLADVAADPAAAVAGLSPPTGGGGGGGRPLGGGGGGGNGPYGLETPDYDVLSSRPAYEVRRYSPFTVASTVMPDGGSAGDGEVASALASGGGFNTLARYLFGGNAAGEAMAMTTPVISTTTTTGSGGGVARREMAFVLPAAVGGVATAPAPRGPAVTVAAAGDDVLAVATFSGWATEGEVRRQKAALLASLAADGVLISRAGELLVMQYDPPGTPPLSRRNEVAVRVAWEDPPVVV